MQKPAAQIDEQHLHHADIGEIKRVAERGEKNEQREPLRRQDAGKHECLQKACAQCAGRRSRRAAPYSGKR